MKASTPLWKDALRGQLPPQLESEIDAFERDIELRRLGRIDERVFAEIRLRRGVYGQRYDNGRRHDGHTVQIIPYPSGKPTKGPDAHWDAPGMQRIKIPAGGLNARQLEVIAELAEEYSTGVAHVTTRQDFQLHYVHLEDTPAIMRRLAAVGITTREACGNTVRNVTACPLSGVCRTELFDVTPYAKAMAYFLLGHPDCQDFGRKFKIAFSGCADRPCALARMHDLGFVAKVVEDDEGRLRRGFEVWVGGGLGPVPYQAQLLVEFAPEEEILPLAQAVARIFARLGEKKNRNAARLKFLVAKLGIERFRELVHQERTQLPPDPRWTAYLDGIDRQLEQPLREPGLAVLVPASADGFGAWLGTNVYRQKQPGYVAVTIALPLGDITADQLRAVADLARKYTRETIRTTIEQNLLLRWVSEKDLPELYAELKRVGLAEPVAGTVCDVVACPGTSTCRLGIASSRGLAAELRQRLANSPWLQHPVARGLQIKISGCFNSCGQHHVGDIGLFGAKRNRHGYEVPHFQLLLGARREHNASQFGMPIAAIPAKRVPEAIERLLTRFVRERHENESLADFVNRIGRAACKQLIEDLLEVPPHTVAAELYTDWYDPREFTIADLGVGECAGEVVSPIDFQLAACERMLFEAQLRLEEQRVQEAVEVAHRAMEQAAEALLRVYVPDLAQRSEPLVERFRMAFANGQQLFDPRCAQYLLRIEGEEDGLRDVELARRRIHEAQLFLEAAHDCHSKLLQARAGSVHG